MARIISFFLELAKRNQSVGVTPTELPVIETPGQEGVVTASAEPAAPETAASAPSPSERVAAKNAVVERIREATTEVIEQARISAKQAFIIDQMVTSLEELTLMIRNTADDVGKVLELARASEQAAIQGGESAKSVVTSIDRILKSNQEITSVTDTVQLIARESKLISINSMVEAARAGQQGLTFMVVAKRIQELAANAASSAGKINGVTSAANGYVHESQTAADSCQEQLNSIVGRSTEVSGVIERLNSSMRSQANLMIELNQVVVAVRNEIQVASMKLEHGVSTLPELLDAIEQASCAGGGLDLGGSGGSASANSDASPSKADSFDEF